MLRALFALTGLVTLAFISVASAARPCCVPSDNYGCFPPESFERARACATVPSDPKEALELSTDVFSGEVVGMQKVGFNLVVTFKVETIWKGDDFRTYVGVATPTGREGGSYSFRKGGHYLVYCQRIPSPAGQPARVTSTSTRTQPLEAAEKNDLLVLGEGRKPAN